MPGLTLRAVGILVGHCGGGENVESLLDHLRGLVARNDLIELVSSRHDNIEKFVQREQLLF